MRAQVLTKFGGPENFVLTNIPKPAVEPGKLLIRVAATSVNQIDIKIRGGLPIGPDLPAILGCDVAGIVEEVGAGVINFAPGDAVYGCAGGVKGQGGTMAEYMIAADAGRPPEPGSFLARYPDLRAELVDFLSVDGKTPLLGLLQFPSNFDPSKRYPMLVKLVPERDTEQV